MNACTYSRFIHSPTCLFIHPPLTHSLIQPSRHPSINSLIALSVHPLIYSSTHLLLIPPLTRSLTHSYFHPTMNSSIHPTSPSRPPIRSSIHLSHYPPIYSSLYLSTHLSIHPSIHSPTHQSIPPHFRITQYSKVAEP